MQSKNALVNHYRSLSLMASDDFSKIINKQIPKVNDGFDQKLKEEFDDISSIYTTRLNNNVLENTLKKVKDREIALSAMEE
jgi:hypothetical protein